MTRVRLLPSCLWQKEIGILWDILSETLSCPRCLPWSSGSCDLSEGTCWVCTPKDAVIVKEKQPDTVSQQETLTVTDTECRNSQGFGMIWDDLGSMLKNFVSAVVVQWELSLRRPWEAAAELVLALLDPRIRWEIHVDLGFFSQIRGYPWMKWLEFLETNFIKLPWGKSPGLSERFLPPFPCDFRHSGYVDTYHLGWKIRVQLMDESII